MRCSVIARCKSGWRSNAPEKINTDAHAAWILKLELSDPAEADGLLDAAAYEAFVKEETGH